MYIELDGDDVAVTYIKDVVFNANRADVETLRMAKVFQMQYVFDFFILTFIWAMSLCRWIAAALCDGQMDHRDTAEPAYGLHCQLWGALYQPLDVGVLLTWNILTLSLLIHLTL